MVKGNKVKRQKKEKLILVNRTIFGYPNNKREFMVDPELKKYVLWLVDEFAFASGEVVRLKREANDQMFSDLVN